MNFPINTAHHNAQPALATYDEAIRALQAEARSPNTLRAYRSGLKQFAAFCDERHLPPDLRFPADPYTVAAFIVWLDGRGLKAPTISHRLTALSVMHKKGGFDDPTKATSVVEAMEGLRRQRARAGERPDRKQPTSPEMLRAISDKIGHSIFDARDWAILLLGFSGLMRRSEIAALHMEDVEWRTDGLVLHIRMSKTDQTGEGDIVGIPPSTDSAVCPIAALRRYLALAQHKDGPLFRNHGNRIKHAGIDPRVVARAVKRLVKRADLDPSKFAGHSLRAGGATAMAEAGADLGLITKHGRWKSTDTVARHYIRPANALSESNPARKVL